jgi:hypothetical protein
MPSSPAASASRSPGRRWPGDIALGLDDLPQPESTVSVMTLLAFRYAQDDIGARLAAREFGATCSSSSSAVTGARHFSRVAASPPGVLVLVPACHCR